MTPTTTVQLGDFTFGKFEVPESIPFGGEQALVVHKLVGGTKVVDAMGYFPDGIAWSGHFFGSDAEDRALSLEAMMQDGQTRTLSWSSLLYSVVVRSVKCNYERINHIPYRIECEVIQDQTAAAGNSEAGASVDDLINGDLSTANDLASGFSSLTDPMASLTSAIGAVSTFANASSSVIASVAAPLGAAQSAVTSLLASQASALTSASFVGGASVATLAGALSGQAVASAAQATLSNLSGALGRIAGNLGTINAGASTLSVMSGNVYQIASQQYGDAMAFPAVMAANGLTDPDITGPTELQLPATGGAQDGILDA